MQWAQKALNEMPHHITPFIEICFNASFDAEHKQLTLMPIGHMHLTLAPLA